MHFANSRLNNMIIFFECFWMLGFLIAEFLPRSMQSAMRSKLERAINLSWRGYQ